METRQTADTKKSGKSLTQIRKLTLVHTGDSRYVDFAYLDIITYVEVIFHSQHFCSIYLSVYVEKG